MIQIKTIMEKSLTEIDNKYNEFTKTHDVKFSQTDVINLDGQIYHKITIFFELKTEFKNGTEINYKPNLKTNNGEKKFYCNVCKKNFNKEEVFWRDDKLEGGEKYGYYCQEHA